MNSSRLGELIQSHWPELSPHQTHLLICYYELILIENQIQNLTKLTTPEDFFWGHLWDVKEWAQLQWGVEGISLDLGSGAGIPGIPMAIVTGGRWVITDSEGRKADFLCRVSEKLELQSRVTVYSGRAEDFLKKEKWVDRIVSRAVGKVQKIYSWIRPCSTWNTLILMKGPGWEREWIDFNRSKYKQELTLLEGHEYTIPFKGHMRTLVRLIRS